MISRNRDRDRDRDRDQAAPSPPRSALSQLLHSTTTTTTTTTIDPLHALAQQVLHNLQHQHDWTDLCLHTHTHTAVLPRPLPRPLVQGRPPQRIYIHPDEQIEQLRAATEAAHPASVPAPPAPMWVLPSHVREKWSLRRFADVFDALAMGETKPEDDEADAAPEVTAGAKTRATEERKVKHLLLATVNDDSTIVYYIVHDGIVKPRQN
ncbi:MAG: hypothetical protein M1826_007448 [Phylliscum demangeonii]|nr:MAG: hypothetical protein M1826_007448 [Phylliscum demangeonii]